MKLPLIIYEHIKESDPAELEKRIIKEFKEEFLILLVELILRVSAGNKELEKELADLILKDLETLKTKRDMIFINKLLLPLIRNEKTVPICLVDNKNL